LKNRFDEEGTKQLRFSFEKCMTQDLDHRVLHIDKQIFFLRADTALYQAMSTV
jgi:N-dimethylarginine dimethylaminohydrolase